jgi:hypothetical protein
MQLLRIPLALRVDLIDGVVGAAYSREQESPDMLASGVWLGRNADTGCSRTLPYVGGCGFYFVVLPDPLGSSEERTYPAFRPPSKSR